MSWDELKSKYHTLTQGESLWFQICFASYFEIECLRNDYHKSIVVESEPMENVLDPQGHPRNMYILCTKQFKLCFGKTVNYRPVYFDIPDNLIRMLRIVHEQPMYLMQVNPVNNNWWNYNFKRVLRKYYPNLSQGPANFLRILKAKYIESLDIPETEKCILHNRMLHKYQTAREWYGAESPAADYGA